MGYSKTVPSNTLSLFSTITNEEEIRTTGPFMSGTLQTMNIPNFTGDLLCCFLIYNVNMMKNSNAGTNYFTDFQIEVSGNGGVSWLTAISGFAPMLEIPATSNAYGLFTFSDDIDVKAHIHPGGTLQIRYVSANTIANANSIFLYSVFTRLELMFK